MVTAVFNCGDYARTVEIWQWDYGQVLRIQGLSLPAAVEIHFALQESGGESVTRIGVTKDGVTDVTIPDSLLENDGTAQRYSIYAFIYLTDTNSGQTIKKITIPVKSRPKPQPFDTPEDAQLFREAIKAVNDAADRAGTSEKLAEGWAHGREDMPERAQDNAMYYAGKASEDARQTAADRETVKEMVDSVSDIEQQVEAVKGYAGKAQTAAKEAAKSQEASEGAAKAAGESATAAELSRQQAGQYATDAAERASDASDSADQASSHATKAGQAYTSTVELSGRVQTVITQTGDTQVQAINLAGATQVQAIKTEGAKQVQAVQDAAQEIAADREQIKTNKEDITTLKSDKVDKDQGAENAGKVLGIGADGQVTPVEMGGGDVTIDQLLPIAIKATSDKAEILNITDSADFKMQGFNLYGRTEQVQTNGYQLFDASKLPTKSAGNATVTNNGDGSFTISGSGEVTDRFNLAYEYSHKETIKLFKSGMLKLKTEQTTNPYFVANLRNKDGQILSLTNNTATMASIDITNWIKDETCFLIIQFWGAPLPIKAGTIKPMLYQDGDGTWEPFAGGFPSPRPQMRSKNLANPDDIVIGELASDTGLELAANNRIRTGYIPVTAGASYKYRAIYVVSNAHMYNTDKTRVGNYSSSVPIPEGVTYIRMSFGKIDNSDLTNNDLDNFKDAFMLNEGNTALPYEPYIIEEWPQEIKNSGRLNEETGKYEVQVKLTGAQLFDGRFEKDKVINTDGTVSTYKGRSTTDFIRVDPNTQYSGFTAFLRRAFYDGNKKLISYNDDNATTDTTPSNCAYVRFCFVNDSVVMFNAGSTAKPYEPYKEQSITLTSDRPLTKWDYLDRRDGVWGWVYKSKSKVIDGTETFLINNGDTYIGNKTSNVFMVIDDIVSANYNEQNGYCNKLKHVPLSWGIDKDGQIGFCYNAKQIHLRLDNYCTGVLKTDAKETAIEKITNYLKAEHDKGSPLTFLYETESETFTPLSDTEQQALNALVTYYPTTIITNNVNARIQAQYVADPANYIANHYVSKEDTQTIMQRISNIETAMLKL